MRTPSVLPLVLLLGAALPLAFAAQDPVGEEPGQDRPLAPFTAFQEKEKARLAAELEGAWSLVRFDNPDDLVDQRDVRGFATFTDGFLTLVFQGRLFSQGLFSGERRDYVVQAGVYRYRIDDSLRMQTATAMAFHNNNPDLELQSEPADGASEYDIVLADEELKLRRNTGVELTFRKVRAGEFPEEAIQLLDRRRSGRALRGR